MWARSLTLVGCGMRLSIKVEKVLAYVFEVRKDEVFLQLKALLEPFGSVASILMAGEPCVRHLEVEKHKVGKQNTQKIES